MTTQPATTQLLDPTSERSPTARPRAPRLGGVEAKTIGLLDIAKARGDVFLDRIEQHLVDRGATVVRFAKPTFTKPAPIDLRHRIATECAAVVEALAD